MCGQQWSICEHIVIVNTVFQEWKLGCYIRGLNVHYMMYKHPIALVDVPH